MGIEWLAFRKNHEGKTLCGSLSLEMLGVLPNVISSFLYFMEESNSTVFDVGDLYSFIIKKHKNIIPFYSNEKRSSVRKKYPGKIILDIQDSCYHLSGPASFWIKDSRGRKVVVLEHDKERMQYSILPNWRTYFG